MRLAYAWLTSVYDVRTFSLAEQIEQALNSEPKRDEFLNALYELRDLAETHAEEAA